MGKRVYGLDLLRAFAVVFVMIYHFPKTGCSDWFRLLGHWGWTGVDLFFVLSGYLIAGQLFESMKKSGTISIRRFYFKRFFRTLPSYFVILGMYIIFPIFREGRSLVWWKYFVFLQNFGIPLAFSHSWSLCVEEHFYLVIPWLVAFFWSIGISKKRKTEWVGALVLVWFCVAMVGRHWIWNRLGIASTVEQNVDHAYELYLANIYYPTTWHTEGLIIGVLLASVRCFLPEVWISWQRRSNLLVIVGLFALVTGWLAAWKHVSWSSTVFAFPLVAIGYGALVVACSEDRSILSRWSVPGVGPIALASYAVYLTHVPALGLAWNLFESLGVGSRLVFFLIYIGQTAAMSLVLYQLVEKPSLRLRNQILAHESKSD